MGFASLLHGHGTCIYQFQAIFEAQGTGSNQGREFAERVSGSHFRLEGIAHAEGRDYGVEEYGRLCNLCLTEVFVRAVEHDISNAISEDIIRFFKQFFG